MAKEPTDKYGSISIAPGKSGVPPTPTKAAPKKPTRKQRKESQARQPRRVRRDTAEIKRGGKRLLFWFGLLAVLFGLYSGAGYVLVPYLVQNKLPDYLADRTSAYITTGRISFNPYNFKLVARDISAETMVDGQAEHRFLTIDDLRINLDFLSLLRGELTSSELRLERLKLHVIRNQDKSYNISYLFGNRSLQNQSEIIDFAELPFLFSFNNISIAESRIIIDDNLTQKQHVIKDLELALPVISNFPYQTDSYIHPRFSAVINGSPVTLTGEASFGGGSQPGRQTQLSMDINDIDIPLYFDYLPLTLPVDISRGNANGVLHLTFSPEEQQGSRFKIRFNLEATDLSMESRDAKMSLSMPGARLEGSLEPFTRALTFKSILLREPAIVTEQAENQPIGATLASLAPLALRPSKEHKLHQVIPPISLKLLIADNGSFEVRDTRKNKSLQRWKSIQLSIKNFSNDALIPSEEESTFRLSGEHDKTAAYFTWQGNFDDQNRPGGNLQMSNAPAAIVAPFLGRKPEDVSGSADLKGLLSFEAGEDKNKKFAYSLKSSTLSIRDLELKEQGKVWLRTPLMRCDPVSRIKGITDLGNIYLHNSTVILDRDKLPYLFLVFSARPTEHVMHGIDFSGRVTINGDGKTKPTIRIRDTIFQANKLERQETQKENFVLSGMVGATSELKAKGSLHIAPVQINTEFSASNLTPRQLFSWFSKSPRLLTPRATLSVQGTFLYPQQEFKGELVAENVQLGPVKAPSFTAGTVHFNDLIWSKSRQSLSAGKLLVDKPSFTWHRPDKEKPPVSLVSNFLRSYLLPEAGKKDADPDLSLAKFSVSIDQIGISNGKIAYSDERTKPTLSLSLNGINGDVTNLQYPVAKDNGTISLNGSIEGYPFKIEGETRLLQSPPSALLEFSASSLPLQLFSAQVKGRVQNVATEKVSVDITHRVTYNQQSASHETRFTLNGLAPEKSGTNLATAFALLSSDGALTIELKDDQLPSRPLIDQALDQFSRTVIKATINPMLLADPKFVDLAEKNYVTFLPGSDQFTGEGLEHLNRYGELLSAYPLINLKITGLADPERDVGTLMEELKKAEQVRVNVENQKRALEWEKKQQLERMKLQIWADAEDTIDEVDIPVADDGFVPVSPRPVQVTNEVLNELAVQRQQAVADYLIEQLSVDPDRLAQAPTDRKGIVSGGDSPRAVISLTDGYDRAASKAEAPSEREEQGATETP